MASQIYETDIKKDFTLSWTIEESLYSHINPLGTNEQSITKEFVYGSTYRFKWQLRIVHTRGHLINVARVFVRLLDHDFQIEKVKKIKYKCEGVVNWIELNNQEILEFTANNICAMLNEFENDETYLFTLPCFLWKSADLRDLHIKCHIQLDPLILAFRMRPFDFAYKKPEQSSLNTASAIKKKQIIWKLLEEKPNEDIQVICKGNQFNIHKFLLTSQSEVFTRMFEVNMKENLENRIVIEDFEPEVVELFMHYLTDVSVPWEIDIGDMAKELFKMSHKYEIDDLKTHCEALLCQQITLDNVIKMLDLAKTYNSPKLEDSSMNFIIIERRNLYERNEFARLVQKNPSLMQEIKSKLW